MLQALKKIIKSHLCLNVLYYIVYLTLKVRIPILCGYNKTNSWTRHSLLEVNESENYIKSVFSDYCRAAGISDFRDKDVLELGPGDNSGVGLLFIANGAKNVDLADRFYSKRSSNHQNIIYKALAKSFPSLGEMLKTGISENHPKLKRYCGPSAAAEMFFDWNRKYDVIVSKDVL